MAMSKADCQASEDAFIAAYAAEICDKKNSTNPNSNVASAASAQCSGTASSGDDFLTRHVWLLVSLAVMAALLTLSRIFHLRWQKTSKSRKEYGEDADKLASIRTKLVMHFLPNAALESLQFKGMRRNETGIGVEFKDLGLTLKNGMKCLAGVTGAFPQGRMVAIMGPSGCGKSTFLNVLCGKATYGTMTGELKINGKTGNMQDLKSITGFVPQDDVVHEKLTVREQIHYSAELRCEVGTDASRLQDIVRDTLNVLQVDHIQGSIVGGVEERGISGGQRKRVNIGLELAACPTLLFLDEPTSGLDSTSSLLIINSLKKMTSLNMTIIMVIHQPRYSLFTLFDQVLLLGKGGLTCYLGPATDAVAYFESIGFKLPANENPADWLMDVLSGTAHNLQNPNFELKDLIQAWKDKGAAFVESLNNKGDQGDEVNIDEELSQQMVLSRAATQLEERNRVIEDMIEEEWSKLTAAGQNSMDLNTFQSFVEACIGSKIAAEELRRIVDSVTGSSNADSVKKDDFKTFVCTEASAQEALTRRSRGQGAEADMSQHIYGVVDKLEDEITGKVKKINEVIHATSGSAVGADEDFLALKRRTPRMAKQFRIVLHRRMIQWWRQVRDRVLDLGLVVVCSAVNAGISMGKTEALQNVIFMHLGLCLAVCVSALKIFSDRAIFWRESARGMSPFAFFYARTIANLFDMLNHTVAYVVLFYLITQPPVSFEVYFIPCLCAAYVAASWGYLLSALLPPDSATVASVVLMLVLAGLLSQPSMMYDHLGTGNLMEIIVGLSPTRWSTSMFFLSYHDNMGGLTAPKPPVCPEGFSARKEAGMSHIWKMTGYLGDRDFLTAYNKPGIIDAMGPMGSGAFVLILEGTLIRILGCLCLKYTNRDKQV